MQSNPYEKQNRHKKATMLVDLLEKSDLTVEQIEKLSSSERDIVSTLAGVNKPSEETWNLVIQLIKNRASDPLAA
jgi:hypothetical protein